MKFDGNMVLASRVVLKNHALTFSFFFKDYLSINTNPQKNADFSQKRGFSNPWALMQTNNERNTLKHWFVRLRWLSDSVSASGRTLSGLAGLSASESWSALCAFSVYF